MKDEGEHGASMVEFAIVLPLLLLVLIGIIDFGRIFLIEAMVTNGAREGARMAAFSSGATNIGARADAAMPDLDTLTGGTHTVTQTVVCPAAPTPTSAASVTVSVTGFNWIALGGIGALFGATIDAPTPSATSSMRCTG